MEHVLQEATDVEKATRRAETVYLQTIHNRNVTEIASKWSPSVWIDVIEICLKHLPKVQFRRLQAMRARKAYRSRVDLRYASTLERVFPRASYSSVCKKGWKVPCEYVEVTAGSSRVVSGRY